MSSRRVGFRIAAVAACSALVLAPFLPIVFVVFMAGGAPQGGQASLWAISPVAAGLVASACVVAGSAALLREPRRQARWLGPLGGSLIGSALLAAAYTFSPIAAIGVHPAGLSAVALGGVFFLVAARLGRGDGMKVAPVHDPLAG